MTRERPVPCANSTQWEALNNQHTTWNDNRVCNRCVRIQDLFTIRRKLNETFEEDEDKTQ